MNFSSNEVCKLLEDNKLLEIPNTSGKSTVWQNFLYLNHIESKDCIEYVICNCNKKNCITMQMKSLITSTTG